MWNLLTTLAAFLLAVSAILGYMNQKKLEETRVLRTSAEKKLEDVEKKLAAQTTTIEQNQSLLESTTSKAETAEQNVRTLKETRDGLEEKNSTLISAKDDLASDLERYEGLKSKLGEIQEIKNRLNKINSEAKAVNGTLAAKKSRLASLKSQRQSLQNSVENFTRREEDRRNGVIQGNFTTTVKEVNTDWGFVVLNAGNTRGVVPKAKLAVLRGGVPVAKLVVTNVEQGSAIADPQAGSSVSSVRSGDVVVKDY